MVAASEISKVPHSSEKGIVYPRSIHRVVVNGADVGADVVGNHVLRGPLCRGRACVRHADAVHPLVNGRVVAPGVVRCSVRVARNDHRPQQAVNESRNLFGAWWAASVVR